MRRVEQFRKGPYYCLGKILTAFPCNLLAFVVVYGLMMPLTARFLQNFDVLNFKRASQVLLRMCSAASLLLLADPCAQIHGNGPQLRDDNASRLSGLQHQS